MESIWRKVPGKTLVYLALAGYVCGLLAAGPAVSGAVADGIQVCLRVLAPSLFPFLVFSGMAASTGLMDELGDGLAGVMGRLFRLPGCCGSIWLIGMLGGYPLGVKAAADQYRSGGLDRKQAERIMGFCACCGPGFLFNTAGLAVFGSVKTGVFLLGIHWAASLLTGFLLTRDLSLHHSVLQKSREFSLPIPAFTGAVCGAVRACGGICGFYLFFRGLAAFLPAGTPAWVLGSLEMSCGITALKGLPGELPLAAAILGWGGLSVHFQAMDLLGGTGLRTGFYWKGKLLHSLLSATLCWLFSRFL